MLLALADTCEVWPAHLGGSTYRGAGMDRKVCSTIGCERDHHPMLRLGDGSRFDQELDEAHVPGSVSTQIQRAGSGSKPAWPATAGQPIVLIGEDELADPQFQVLDVREDHEWDSGHLRSAHLAAWRDRDRVPATVDPSLPIAVICASGQRAATGARLLTRARAKRVAHVVGGGVPTLGRLGEPLQRSGARAV